MVLRGRRRTGQRPLRYAEHIQQRGRLIVLLLLEIPLRHACGRSLAERCCSPEHQPTSEFRLIQPNTIDFAAALAVNRFSAGGAASGAGATHRVFDADPR